MISMWSFTVCNTLNWSAYFSFLKDPFSWLNFIKLLDAYLGIYFCQVDWSIYLRFFYEMSSLNFGFYTFSGYSIYLKLHSLIQKENYTYYPIAEQSYVRCIDNL